jgi:hypothetical protein
MRPEVRLIEPQSEQSAPANIPSWEAEQLLRKYGYDNQQFTNRPQQIQEPTTVDPNVNLTFEEMIAQDEARQREEAERQRLRQQQQIGPKPMTFNGQNGYESEVRYSSDDGFSFKVEITTDMQLPRY